MKIKRFNRFARINEELSGVIEITGLALMFLWIVGMNIKDALVKPDKIKKELQDNKVLKSLVDKVLDDKEIKSHLKELEETKITPEDDSDPVYKKIKAKAKQILIPAEYKLIETYLGQL